MDSAPASYLPKYFDYYAGGHIHITEDIAAKEAGLDGDARIAYPGPVFPASFSELEKLGAGSFIIVESGDSAGGEDGEAQKEGDGRDTWKNKGRWRLRRERVDVKRVVNIAIDASRKSPAEIDALLRVALDQDLMDAVVLLRVEGELREGKVGDIDFAGAFRDAATRGAYILLKNTTRLTSAEYEEFRSSGLHPDEAEDVIIREHLGQDRSLGLAPEEEFALTKALMTVLAAEQQDGEKKYEYEARVVKEGRKTLGY